MKLVAAYAAGALTMLLVFAAQGLLETAYVVSWMACRVITGGNCL